METATKQTEKTEIQLTAGQVLVVRVYRRLKQVEKRLKDRLEKAKAGILAIASGEFVGVEKTVTGEKKIVSVTIQPGKKGFDVAGCLEEFPGAAKYITKGKAFPVIRLH